MDKKMFKIGFLSGILLIIGIGIYGYFNIRTTFSDNTTKSIELSQLELQNLSSEKISLKKGKPKVLNFWATWCPPCVEELPLLDQFYRDNAVKGWQVLGIAIDQKVKVEQFLKKMPLAFPAVLDGASGTQWSRALGNLTGSLPFSAAFSAKSQPIYRKIGKLSDTDLANLKLTT